MRACMCALVCARVCVGVCARVCVSGCCAWCVCARVRGCVRACACVLADAAGWTLPLNKCQSVKSDCARAQSSLDALGDMRKSPISGRNAVINRRLGDLRQLRKLREVPAKPVVKAGTLEREDLARPSYGSGRDVLCSVGRSEIISQ